VGILPNSQFQCSSGQRRTSSILRSRGQIPGSWWDQTWSKKALWEVWRSCI